MARELTFAEAIHEAIDQEMARDPRIFIMGEDVQLLRNPLLEKYGGERVRNTPISESAFMGAATGAAYSGMRPIVELMMIDFFGVAADQIMNHMAKIPYLSAGQLKVPLVIRASCGGGYGDGAHQSQTIWALFAHMPGLKVVIPSTPYDAKGLMIQAIRDDNPVLYLEHKLLADYWLGLLAGANRYKDIQAEFNVPKDGAKGPVPEESYTLPFGRAEIRRQGRDLTIVSVGVMAHRCLAVAEHLAAAGKSVEVIDLRTLVPLDRQTVIDSVKKTRKLLVVDEDHKSYGLTGEIAASVAEEAVAHLDDYKRVAALDTSIPFSLALERVMLPTEESIEAAARAMLK
jgi:pyruvate dehydrogenase E1 component beta subunit